MDSEQTVFKVSEEQADIAYKFEQYNLVSAAVVDERGRLVGRLMVDDIVDVIQEEAEEDILHLGGVGAEETITDTVWQTTRSRFSWLFVNLLTAILASWVISWFGGTIKQMVALAILMPIVASMGGNAGTQTMTVAVRALATRNLGPLNAMRVTLRECSVGLINGVFFAVIVGVFSWWWFGSDRLGTGDRRRHGHQPAGRGTGGHPGAPHARPLRHRPGHCLRHLCDHGHRRGGLFRLSRPGGDLAPLATSVTNECVGI